MNNPLQTNNRALRMPIYLSVFYLVFSVVVYILCPYEWPTKRPILFYSLLLLYILALFFGYMLGQKRRLGFSWIQWDETKTQKLIRLVSYATVINVLMLLIYIFRDYGYKMPNFAGLAEDMLVGLKNPGLGYRLHHQRLSLVDGPNVMGGYIFTALNLVWSFAKVPVAVLSMVYYKKLNLTGKIFAVLYLVLTVVFYISIGTNIQFLHVFLLAEIPFALGLFERWHRKTLNKKYILKFVVFFLLGIILVMAYFGYMMESRSDAAGYEIGEYEISGMVPNIGKDPNENSGGAPTGKLMNLWISFSSYLSQGYYGMSQALTVDWTPMYGVGNSMFLLDMISNKIYDIDQFTYQVKLEEFGWDSDVRWHSMYTWIANDVSFYGVILVMFVLGALFGMMFKDAITTRNPLAQAGIFLFILMVLFIPCNNQIAQSCDTLFPFILLSVLWLITAPKKMTDVPVQVVCES